MEKGIMISFEGDDGAGKSTALKGLAKWLEETGYPVMVSREPGGTEISEKIREILLDVNHKSMDPKTEALLYAASRNQHVREKILPAIEAGTIVLCDRFLDSSLAYQGVGRNLGVDEIEALNDFALEGFRPDLTLFFEVSAKTGKERMEARGDMNRLDLETDGFHQRIRDGFRQIARKDPKRFVFIDAEPSREQVLEYCIEAIQPMLEK